MQLWTQKSRREMVPALSLTVRETRSKAKAFPSLFFSHHRDHHEAELQIGGFAFALGFLSLARASYPPMCHSASFSSSSTCSSCSSPPSPSPLKSSREERFESPGEHPTSLSKTTTGASSLRLCALEAPGVMPGSDKEGDQAAARPLQEDKEHPSASGERHREGTEHDLHIREGTIQGLGEHAEIEGSKHATGEEGDEDGEGGRRTKKVTSSSENWLASFAPVVIDASAQRRVDMSKLRRDTTECLSKESSQMLFDWLVAPFTWERFHHEICTKRPCLIKRTNARDYFDGVFGKSDVERLLQGGTLKYGLNVDVTNYQDGHRETLNEEGLADPSVVWRQFSEGCTVRVLHPQQWNDTLWWMLSTLERCWDQIAGSNVYLTPAGAQGFSPHFDDIDAYILQMEGSKQWKVYKPPGEQDCLARFSSPDFAQDALGPPVLDAVLMPGDLLYLPRGTVHQAVSTDKGHSLHVTISTGQRNTVADFLQMALPRALELAAEEHLELRQNMPPDVFDFMGVVHSDSDEDPRRTAFMGVLKSCLMKILESGPWDSAVDQLAGNFMQRRLPPYTTRHLSEESTAESHTGAAKQQRKRPKKRSGEHPGSARARAPQLSPETRLLAAVEGGCRLIVEDDSAVVYHMMANARESHNEGDDMEDMESASETKGRVEFPLECAHWLEALTSLSATQPTSITEVIERCNPGEDSSEDRRAVLSIVQALLDNHVLHVYSGRS